MNIDKLIDTKKRNLTHGHHGGEIYDLNYRMNHSSLLDFSTNVNPLITPDYFKQTLNKALDLIPIYPDSNSTCLKEELVNFFHNEISIENIIVGAGSMEIISLFCDAFIKSESEMIISQPTFSEYAWAIQKNGGTTVNVYRKPENDFKIEVDPIINKISSKTSAIFVCNPNNPNGCLDRGEDIEKIIKNASEHNVLVFLDEAFIEFTGESNSFVRKINSFDNLFVSRSFTKFFGLTGLRVGFGVSTPEIIDIVSRDQALWSVNCFGQICAQEMLKSKDFIDKSLKIIAKERHFLIAELEKFSNFRIFPTNANYVLFNIEKTGIKVAELKERLFQKNILIRDCSNYEGLDEYYIRVAIKDRKSNLRLIQSLKKEFASHN